ncbi:MAG: glycosyltransferase [Polyangiaceae bacterium]
MDAESWLTLAPIAASSLVYAAMMGVCAAGITRARRAPAPMPERAPRVTILKPLAGSDDELEANLRTFASLDYPDYEILFGVASPTDGALPAARRFLAAYPGLARIVFTDPDNATNPKVAQLIDMDRKVTGEVIVISDSNVRVERDYLWSLLRELEVPGTGIVTSIFVGSGEQTLGAALENLQLCAVTAPGIIATNLATPWPATIGKSMAMRRRDLVRLGGFARFGELLAEDQAMGEAFAAAGLGVRTSLDVVHNRNVTCSVRRTFDRHTRWSKLRRSLHPTGYLFEPFLSPLAVATIVALIAHTQLALAAAGVVAIAQTITAALVTTLLRGSPLAWRYAPLEIVRTYLHLVCWAAPLVSMRIQWRGHPFLLRQGSIIVPAPPGAWATLRARFRAARA